MVSLVMDQHLVLVFLTIIVTSGFHVGFGQFSRIQSCVCTGSIITYKCTANGPGFTIWRGSAFNCSANEIFLRHSIYDTPDRASGRCNNGAISGSSLPTSGDNNYTSLLTVNLTAAPTVVGRTIECVYRNPADGVERVIGSDIIAISNERFPPPSDVQLASVQFNELNFNWSSVDNACSSLRYSINSDCGTCSNAASVVMPFATCSIEISDYNEVCTFAVNSVVCDVIIGNFSNQVSVPLRVPEPPLLNVLPTYNQADALIWINITFLEMESFGFSNQIDGAPVNYTLVYNNTMNVCYLASIPAASCKLGDCAESLSGPSLLNCSKYEDVIIRLRATNRLGTGPLSDATIISNTNQYVDVKIESNGSVICKFRDQRSRQVEKTCEILFGQCVQQKDTIFKGVATSNDSIRIDIPAARAAQSFCYTVKASYNNFTINIDGIHRGMDSIQIGAVIGGVVGGVALCLSLATIIIVIIVAIVRYSHRSREETYEAHVVFDVEDKEGQLQQALKVFHKDYDISTLYLGKHRDESGPDGVRRVYIKFDIENNSEFELDIDKLQERLDPDEQPPKKMMDSIEIHKEPTTLTAKGIYV